MSTTDRERTQEAAVELLGIRERLDAQREIREWVLADARRRLERVLEAREQLAAIQERVERTFEESRRGRRARVRLGRGALRLA
jgi:hypothetical protein